MDPENLFATPMTYRHLRAEFGLGMVAAAVLLIIHRKQVRLPVAVGMFAYADSVGYIPGAIVYRVNDGKVPKPFYVLYNVAHSAITATIVTALWARFVKREWALLAIPLHLFGDRAVFGNIAKPFALSFEPEPHPVYERVRDLLETPAEELPADAVVLAGENGTRATGDQRAPSHA